MTLPPDIAAIREGIALAHEPQVALVRVDGPGAAALLDAVATRPPPRRDGLAVPALLLRPDASVFADVLVCADDGGLLLLAEGTTGPALVDHLRSHATTTTTLRDLGPDHELVSLHGPFAWEPTAALVGPEVLAVPPMTTFRLDPLPGLGLRASRTGEYGYVFILPRADAHIVHTRLAELQTSFAIPDVSSESLDLCGLENGFYCARTPGLANLTPVELQLQWRVRHGRPFIGAEALQARQTNPRSRITWWYGEPGTPVPESGAALHLADHPIGHIVHAVHSPLLARPIGLALLARPWAHPHLPCTLDDGAVLLTAAPPLLNNRSMHVRPQTHRHAHRDQYTFPPLLDPRFT